MLASSQLRHAQRTSDAFTLGHWIATRHGVGALAPEVAYSIASLIPNLTVLHIVRHVFVC